MPSPDEALVPVSQHRDHRYHWVHWPHGTGSIEIKEWSPTTSLWFSDGRVRTPEQMCGYDYLGPAIYTGPQP